MSVVVKPHYEDSASGIVIYHGDAREIAPRLTYDAVVSDPPYGMAWNTDSTRFSGGGDHLNRNRQRKRGLVTGRSDYRAVHGDSETFDPSPWLGVMWCVLFGYHHFAQTLPPGSVLVWVKRDFGLEGTFLSDAELAWKKGGCGVYVHHETFYPSSRLQEAASLKAVHPTQKPVGLMRWAIERSGAPETAVILDPFTGSGTTLVAAKQLGRRAIGIEIEERYCEIAAERLRQSVLNFDAPREPEPEQGTLLDTEAGCA